MSKTVAALYVATGGCYYGLDDVDPWDEARDARNYPGPYPVIAHPPCERCGAFSEGGFNHKYPHLKTGDDGGCFASAIESVRRFTGVIEHPLSSKAWKWFNLPGHVGFGDWSEPDSYGGRTCAVRQSAYGHKTTKPTLLYAVGVDFSIPISSENPPVKYAMGPRRSIVKAGKIELPAKERHLTPIGFRDLLLRLVNA